MEQAIFISIISGLITYIVRSKLKESKDYLDKNDEILKELKNQSAQLLELTTTIKFVMTDKIPHIERRLDKLEDQ